VGALIAAGMVGVLGMLIASPFANWTLAATLANIAGMLCALNGGYLLGFAISCLRARLAAKAQEDSFVSHQVAKDGRMAMFHHHR
jgi:hypothetical protein